MQVRVEDLSSVKKKLHIEIPEEEVTRELNEAYKKLNSTSKIKGFRPGKVPRSVLERLYKKNVDAEISSKLIQESFADAIKETDLKFLGNPLIDPPEPKAKAPYKYEAVIEFSPELRDIDFKGLTLKKSLYKVTDETMEAQLQEIQKTLGQLKPIEENRPAREGDILLIDFEGFRDGKPFDQAPKSENFTMKIGGGQLPKEFDEKLVGMSPEETGEVNVHFPEDHPSELANLEIIFKIKLNEIREEIIPDLDDELAKRLGKETLEDVRADIANDLKQGYEKRVEQEMAEQIFESILEKQDFEVPDVLVDYQLESIITEAEKSFSYRNISMEDIGLTREVLAEKYRDTAVKQVKRSLILSKLIDQEKQTLSDEALEKGMKGMAEALNKTPLELKNHYKQNKEEFDYFKHALLEKQVIDLIIAGSDIEEVEPEQEKAEE
ncbi:trigger factor [Desulfococcaceae bacterium HSG8]|nr:trigger factor [Desulfococcaceae bacterium HSG8]